MKELFLKQSLQLITANQTNTMNEEMKEKILYGLEGLDLSITKLFIISFLAFLLHFFKEFLITLLFFNGLRYPGFGFHANNSKTCLVCSTLLILGLPYLLYHIEIVPIVKNALCLISVLLFSIYAPADTKKRPLTNKRKRMIRKIAATSLAIVYSILILTISNQSLSQLLLASLLIETVLILPITYRLFHASYANYKNMV